MAFLKSIASVFQPREVKVVRERQERSVKVTEKIDFGPYEWKWTVSHWIHSLSCDRLVLTLASRELTVQFFALGIIPFFIWGPRTTHFKVYFKPSSLIHDRSISIDSETLTQLDLTSKIDYILDYMMRIQIMPSDQVSL